MAYNIIELNESLSQNCCNLQEKWVFGPDVQKEELIYKILDEQAIAETQKIKENHSAKQANQSKQSGTKPQVKTLHVINGKRKKPSKRSQGNKTNPTCSRKVKPESSI